MKKLQNIVYSMAFWLILLVIGFLVFDKVVMPIWSGRYKARLETPDLQNLSAEEAESIIASKNIKVYWMPEAEFSATVPKGNVLSQVPKPGREIKEGRTLILTVSKGLREIQIPNFRGKSKRQAQIALQQMGLVEGEQTNSKHATIPVGVIIRSEPAEDNWVKIGSKVDLVISSGRGEGTYLPNFIGSSFESAKIKIDSLGFASKIEYVEDAEDVLPNTILNQSPLGGEYLEDGVEIILKVSK